MQTFKDFAGRTWSISITAETVRRVREQVKFNLCETMEPEMLNKIANDPVIFCEILYSICRPEADAKCVSIEQFGDGLGGDTLEFAINAFLEELINFFPTGKRRIYSQILKQINETEKVAILKIEERMNDPSVRQSINEKLTIAIDKSLTSAGS